MSGIAAPAPRTMVTVLGLDPDAVRVVDTSGVGVDVVQVELGDAHLAGPLHTLTQVLARAADGLAAVDAARPAGTEGCSGYGPDPDLDEDGPAGGGGRG